MCISRIQDKFPKLQCIIIFNRVLTALYEHQQHLTRIRFRKHSNQPSYKTSILLLNKKMPNTKKAQHDALVDGHLDL